jgi:phage repressor protein C with HTH and peptisase S24 domain
LAEPQIGSSAYREAIALGSSSDLELICDRAPLEMKLQGNFENDKVRTVVVSGDAMLPLYRHGDHLIVSESVPIRIGDRVVVQTERYGTVGGILVYRNGKCVVVDSGGIKRNDFVIDASEVDFLGRVIWASQ